MLIGLLDMDMRLIRCDHRAAKRASPLLRCFADEGEEARVGAERLKVRVETSSKTDGAHLFIRCLADASLHFLSIKNGNDLFRPKLR
jgi:hypothetical protein